MAERACREEARHTLAWENKQDSEWEKEEIEINKEWARTRTNEAQEENNQLNNLLLHTLEKDNAIDWDRYRYTKITEYYQPKPSRPKIKIIAPKPNINDQKYKPSFSLINLIFPELRKRKKADSKNRIKQDYDDWKRIKQEADQYNKTQEVEFVERLKKWEMDEKSYLDEERALNERVMEVKKRYHNKDQDAIVDYYELVLDGTATTCFPGEWEIDYQADSKTLIIDCSLPDLDCLPTIKSIKYIANRKEFSETHLSNTALNKLFDSVLYQISLKTIHALYDADVINALASIVFNGWVDTTDKATGHNVKSCIMSLQASKDEFLAINLENIEPKACFKHLKGVVGSSKLHSLSPVTPIASIDKEHPRFLNRLNSSLLHLFEEYENKLG